MSSVQIPPTGSSESARAPANDQALVHPFQLGIQDFASYSLIIDARSPHEYAEDHIPGAVNLPVVNDDEYAEVGTTHRTDTHRAYLIGVEYSLRNIAQHIGPLISKFGREDTMLVYCFRGGKRSRLWADNLRTIGFNVDVLAGGWKRYRNWVIEGLETLSKAFDYRVLCGPTGIGKTRLLHALRDEGEQVLDLEGLARHRGSLIGSLPGEPQPTQKTFDTELLAAMRAFDVERPVWVEAESKKIGNLQIPAALHEAMNRAVTIGISAPMPERVRLWHEDYAHFVSDPVGMVDRLEPLKPMVGGEELKVWRELATDGRTAELFERVMVKHYDLCYARSNRRLYVAPRREVQVELNSLSPEALHVSAVALANDLGHPARG